MRVERAPRLVMSSLLFLTTLAAGCTERKATADVGSLPVAPTAYPTGPASIGPGVAGISQDIQALTIQIAESGFGADIYAMQSRPIRLEVWASGGPYTLAIDGLLEPQPLDADGATVIGLTPPGPGRYTMRLSGANADSASLNVRPVGERSWPTDPSRTRHRVRRRRIRRQARQARGT
jgi:hypothetical protein